MTKSKEPYPRVSQKNEAYTDIALLLAKYTKGTDNMTYNEVYMVWNEVYRDLYKDQ